MVRHILEKIALKNAIKFEELTIMEVKLTYWLNSSHLNLGFYETPETKFKPGMRIVIRIIEE